MTSIIHIVRHGDTTDLVAFLAIAAFYLFAEHRAHLLGALPFLLLFACPLMHLFMHHGHGAHRGDDEHAERTEK